MIAANRNPSPALRGKTALITGAASGIGRAVAQLFAREGASVVMADVNDSEGQAVRRQILAEGGQAIFERANVTCGADCARLVERALGEFGGMHVLVNSAGVMRRATIVEITEHDWDHVMTVNVKSIFLLARLVVPIMARSGGGVIINLASGWGIAGGPRAVAYCASKGAVVLLTKAMAVDHGRQNIRVNCICPGDTDTGMLRDEAHQLGEQEERFLEAAAQRPLGRIGKPEEVAQAALYLATDASSFVTGTVLVVDGGGLAQSA